MQSNETIAQNYFKKALNLVCGFLLFSLVLSYLFQALLLMALPSVRQFINTALPFLKDQMTDDFWIYLLSSLTSTFAMALPFFMLAKRIELPMKKVLNFKKIDMKAVLQGSLAGLGGNYTFSLIASALISLLQQQGVESNSPDFNVPTSLLAQISYIVCICVIAPLMEEYVFRGVVLQTLRPFGNTFAVVFSASMFSFLHGNLGQIPSTFIAGLVMGYMAVRTESLWVPIMIHFVNNTFSVVISFLAAYNIDGFNTVLGFVAIGLIIYFVYFAVTFKAKRKKIPDFYFVANKSKSVLTSLLFWLMIGLYTLQFLLSFAV